jgi:hypothetical protein
MLIANRKSERVPMNNAFLFVQVTDSISDLNDHMASKILREVCQSNDLVEELATF